MNHFKYILFISFVALLAFTSSCKPIGQVFYDYIPPATPAILINNNDTYTRTQDVSLTLSAKNVFQMYITNTAGCQSGGEFETYSTTKSWSLGATNQETTVYVKFKDRAGNDSPCYSDSIIHDDIEPVINSVTTTKTDGSYKAGVVIPIEVNFSEIVVVTGTPKLTLETGAVDRALNYVSGSGTSSLLFNYVVSAGDTSSDLDYVSSNAINLNGGAINDRAGNEGILALAEPGAANSISYTKNIIIDTTQPVITDVNSTAPDTLYEIGGLIPIQMELSEPVWVTGTPQLTLETGAVDRVINYVSGSGTTTLVFNYEVTSGNYSLDLDYQSTSALSFNGGSISDLAGNLTVLTLPPPGSAGSLGANKNIVVDAIDPKIVNVSSSKTNGYYKAGAVIPIQVTFAENVTLEGSPTLLLETGTTDREAQYISGSGGTVLNFEYVVQAGDTSADLDYQSINALSLNGGTLKDVSGNDFDLSLSTPGTSGSLAANKALVIDTTPPFVTAVTSSVANGNYTVGAVIPVQVMFNEVVLVSGTPKLTLDLNGTLKTLNYTSGSGSSILIFNYTVAAGELSDGLDYSSTDSLALNGGTISDLAINNAFLTLAEPGAVGSLSDSKNIKIVPGVSSVNSTTPAGSYKSGETISIQINFSDTVTVTGTPKLILETGAVDGSAQYVSQTGTTILNFEYVVSSGHTNSDLDYVSINSLELNGGSILDSNNNAASRILPTPGQANSLAANEAIVIDTTQPIVANVTSDHSNGSFREGEIIDIKVSFSEVVNITGGTPELNLETGVVDQSATYVSGSGTADIIFRYVVQANDASLDLDYFDTHSLIDNGAIFKDTAGNDADLSLPTPGAAHSLSANKAIEIDNIAPSAPSLSINSAATYTNSQFVDLTLSAVSATYMLVSNNSSCVAQSGEGWESYSTSKTGWLLGQINQTAVVYVKFKDNAGNESDCVNDSIIHDNIAPTISAVDSSTGDGTYGIGDSISIDISFSETVTIIGHPTVTLETGTTDRVATCDSVSATLMSCTYLVEAGDNNADLDMVASGLSLGAGVTIKDSSGNDLELSSLPTPGAAHSLSVNRNIVVDPLPVVLNVTSSKTDGTYSPGTAISIQVTLSEPVTVSGSPTLDLNTGSAVSAVSYASGSNSATLNFNYTIGSEDYFADLDYENTGSLKLNGGTIRSQTSQNAVLTLPSPGLAGSLGSNKNLKSFIRNVSQGSSSGEHFGSVLASGDFNGDGKMDLIVGMPDFASGDGRIVVVSGANGSTLFELEGDSGSGEHFGAALAVADLDNDGNSEIIVGAPLSDQGGSQRGKIVVLGGVHGSLLYSIAGSDDGDQFGSSLAAIGDLDGDSKADFIVGAPYVDGAGTDRGLAVIYSGVDGSEIGSIAGNETNALLGYSVAGTGDLDDDGIPDFIISAPYATALGTDRGRVRVYSGASFNVLYTKLGTADGDHFGKTLAGNGDANSDGTPDFMIGSPDIDAGGSDKGQVVIYSGVDGSVLYTKTGSSNNDKLGYSIAFLGNVDSQSGDDFIIGVPNASGGGTARGTAMVYHGHNGSTYYTLNGTENNGAFGRAVLGITPGVESDGNDDFVVSAPLANGSGSGLGKLFIYR